MKKILLNLVYIILLKNSYAYDNMVEVKIDQSSNLSGWTSCATNIFKATNSSLFYRLKTTRDIVSNHSFGYTLTATGEGFENAAYFPPLFSANNPWSDYEELSIAKFHTSAAANVGIPILNPTLYFDPIHGPSFQAGVVVHICVNGIKAANEVLQIQGCLKYSGQPFAVRLFDAGPILTHDSFGNELRFAPPFESTVYNIVIP